MATAIRYLVAIIVMSYPITSAAEINLVTDLSVASPESNLVSIETLGSSAIVLARPNPPIAKDGYSLWETDPATQSFELIDDNITSHITMDGVGVFYRVNTDEVWFAADASSPKRRMLKTAPGPLAAVHTLNNKTILVFQNNSIWGFDENLQRGRRLSRLPSQVGGINNTALLQPKFGLARLLFTLSDGSILSTDGTIANTFVVAESSGKPVTIWGKLYSSKRLSYFFVNSKSGSSQTRSLWRTDGTSRGTFSVRKFTAPNLCRGGRYAFANKLYFGCGAHLWVSNGSATGTHSFARLPSANWLEPFGHVNRQVIFSAYHVEQGARLNFRRSHGVWKTDGTVAGTRKLVNAHIGLGTSSVASSGEPLFFYHGFVGQQTRKAGFILFLASGGLWSTDGSSEGSHLLTDQFNVRLSDVDSVKKLGNQWVFTSFTAGDNSRRLWTTQGTPESTQPHYLTETSDHGAYTNTQNFLTASHAVVADQIASIRFNSVWSSGNNSDDVERYYRHDPNHPQDSSPAQLTAVGDHLYFVSQNRLWITDGTASQTFDKGPYTDRNGFEPTQFFDKRLYPSPMTQPDAMYSYLDGLLYRTWRRNGFVSGYFAYHGPATIPGADTTRKVIPEIDNLQVGGVTETAVIGDRVFISAEAPNDGISPSGQEPYLISENYTGLIKDIGQIRSGVGTTSGSDPREFTPLGIGVGVLFTASEASGGSFNETTGRIDPVVGSGRELWRTDGTEAGTTLVKDIAQGLTDSDPRHLVYVDGLVYFTADDHVSGRELWRSDGTPSGTVIVEDLTPGGSTQFDALVALNDQLMLVIDDGVHGAELWRLDPIANQLKRVLDINAGATGAGIGAFTQLHDHLYFAATNTIAGRELWRTDGTSAGTIRVADIAPGAADSEPAEITVFDDMIYFSADDGSTGRELWRLNPLTLTATLEKEFRSGAEGGAPSHLTVAGEQLFFAASDTENGRELWRLTGQNYNAGIVDLPAFEGNTVSDPYEFPSDYLTAEKKKSLLEGRRSCRALRQLEREKNENLVYVKTCTELTATDLGVKPAVARIYVSSVSRFNHSKTQLVYTEAEVSVMATRLSCLQRRAERKANGEVRRYSRNCIQVAADEVAGIGRIDAKKLYTAVRCQSPDEPGCVRATNQ